MQNAGLASLDLDWRYLAFDVRPESLAEAICGAERMHFVGLNLTVPHKQLAVDMVDVLDESAREWGAVNTIRFEGKVDGGEWLSLGHPEADSFSTTRSVGYNTDADAIVRACEEDLSVKVSESSILLVGLNNIFDPYL